MARKSILTTELSSQIKVLVLNGEKYSTIQRKLNIPAGTWETWYERNTKDFRTNLNKWRETAKQQEVFDLCDTARATLMNVLQKGKSESAKVSAAKFILKTFEEHTAGSEDEGSIVFEALLKEIAINGRSLKPKV